MCIGGHVSECIELSPIHVPQSWWSLTLSIRTELEEKWSRSLHLRINSPWQYDIMWAALYKKFTFWELLFGHFAQLPKIQNLTSSTTIAEHIKVEVMNSIWACERWDPEEEIRQCWKIVHRSDQTCNQCIKQCAIPNEWIPNSDRVKWR